MSDLRRTSTHACTHSDGTTYVGPKTRFGGLNENKRADSQDQGSTLAPELIAPSQSEKVGALNAEESVSHS